MPQFQGAAPVITPGPLLANWHEKQPEGKACREHPGRTCPLFRKKKLRARIPDLVLLCSRDDATRGNEGNRGMSGQRPSTFCTQTLLQNSKSYFLVR